MATITVDTSLLVDGTTADAVDVLTPVANLKTAIEDTLNGIQSFDQLKLASSTLTISSGAVTVSKSLHYIDTEGAASTDDLTTINGGSAGDVLVFAALNGARDVVVKHGTGNIFMDSEADLTLNTEKKIVLAIFDGTNWLAKGIGGGSLSSPPPIGDVTPNTITGTTIIGTTVQGNKFRVPAPTTIGIVSDAVTITQGYHFLDTEGLAASDDLVTISGGSAGDILFIKQANGSRVITVKNSGGNIRLFGAADYTFPSTVQTLMLIFSGSNWLCLNK